MYWQTCRDVRSYAQRLGVLRLQHTTAEWTLGEWHKVTVAGGEAGAQSLWKDNPSMVRHQKIPHVCVRTRVPLFL